MANKEHLELLMQGAGAVNWHKWRDKNPEIKPDLSEADLNWRCLSEANLSEADLTGADLSAADLTGADLSWTNFSKANLTGADLTGAKLHGADLSWTDLSEANLTGTDLSEADLTEADLSEAKLSEADLTGADCRNAKLQKAHLTGALLYGIASFGWDISDVACDYIYLDDKKTRRPSNRSFVPGEFERLYRSLPVVVEFVFEHGMQLVDTLIMDWIAVGLQQKKPKLQLELISIDRKGIYPTAIFAIASPEQKEETYNEIKKRYEETIQILKLQNKQSQRMIQQLLDYNRLLLEKVDHPRLIDTRGGPYTHIEAHGDIKITNIMQAVDDIKRELEGIPEKSFQGKAKSKLFEHLDNIAKEATKGGAKAVAKKLFNFAKTELSPMIPNIMKILTEHNLCS